MNKVMSKFFLLMLAMLMVLGAGSAEAAGAKVLLVPFAVNGPDPSIGKNVTDLLSSSLSRQGYRIVQTKRASSATDAASARAAAKAAGAQFAVYGTVNVLGQSFGIDSRVVAADSKMTRSHHAEGASLLQLAPTVNSVAEHLSGMMHDRNGIADIQVRGLKILDADRVLMRVQTRAGDAVDVDAIDADMRRIWDMGYFSDVTADLEQLSGGETLVFTVKEKPRIDGVQVTGSSAVKLKDITEAMSSRTGEVLNEKVLADDLQIITELYRKKGYYLADVKYQIETRPDGSSAVLNINVDEGKKLYIKEVRIDGMDPKLLKGVKKYTKLRKRGTFSWITGTGILKEDVLKSDAQALQGYLVENGYLDAAVAEPEVTYNDDGITVVFTAKPGTRYKLAEIGFKGDMIVPEGELNKVITMPKVKEKSTYFSLTALQEDIKALTELYQDYGYAFAVVDVLTPTHPDEATVDIFYTLNPKEKVYLRHVILEGNTHTRDNVILRELRIADGQQYDGKKMRRSVVRLNKLNYFSDIQTDLIPTGNPGEVDLKLGVKESHTGVVALGFGYSTYDKFGISANITENNLFGRGYILGAQGYISGREKSFNTSFTNPRINNSNLGFSVQAYAIDNEWVSFSKETIGSRLSFAYPLGEYTKLNWGYRLENYRLYDVGAGASKIIKDYEGRHWASVVSAAISRDTTNSVTFPTEGTKESINLEYGGSFLGGDDNFIKLTADYGFYYGLNENNVLHARGTVGAVFRNAGKEVPAFERFYIGGMDSLRGYSYEDVSPLDPLTGDSIGATHVAYGSLEYIWGVNRELGLSLVPFFDIATSVDIDQNSMFSKLYYSTGLEVRWNSPMGNLRFAYGFPLTANVKGERHRSGRFEFSMGQAF